MVDAGRPSLDHQGPIIVVEARLHLNFVVVLAEKEEHATDTVNHEQHDEDEANLIIGVQIEAHTLDHFYVGHLALSIVSIELIESAFELLSVE